MKKYAFILPAVFIAHSLFCQEKDLKKTAFPVKVSGGLGLRSYVSAGSKSPQYRANPAGYSLFGSVNIQITKHLSLPFSVSYGNRKTSFSQPFNQMGFSPTYKGITLHAGYRSFRFSDYTLNGYNMLGAGFEVQKGWLRSGFVMGRFTKASFSERGDPNAFLRWGYSARMGFGKKENFLDLIFLKAEDNPNSILNFSTFNLDPARNVVLGLVLNQKVKLSKTKNTSITLRADGGFSLYTGNIFAQNFDSSNFENVPPVLFKTVSPNISSRGVLAMNSSLNYTKKGGGLRIGYSRVDPGYASMGIYTTNNDLEVISLAPRFSLLRNKINFNGNLRAQRDNLFGEKKKSTVRILPNASLNLNMAKNFGISATVNFSTMNQTPGIKQTQPIPVSQLMNQANYSVNISPRISLNNGNQNVSFNLGSNKVVDNGLDSERKKYTEFSGLNGSANYDTNIKAISTNFSLGGNYFSLTNFDANLNESVTNDNFGLNTGFSKSFLKNTLSTNLSGSYSISQTRDQANNLNITIAFRPKKHHSFNLGINQTQSAFKNNSNRNFKEFRSTLDYNYKF